MNLLRVCRSILRILSQELRDELLKTLRYVRPNGTNMWRRLIDVLTHHRIGPFGCEGSLIGQQLIQKCSPARKGRCEDSRTDAIWAAIATAQVTGSG